MHEFRDAVGRSWSVSLTCASAARIRDMVGTTGEDGKQLPFDLVDSRRIAESMASLRMSPLLVAEVAFAAVSPQASEKGITRDQFLEGMAGDAIDSAREAIEQEVVLFTPGRLRAVVSSTLTEMARLEAQSLRNAMTTTGHGGQSSSTPGSSGSTPANGQSGSLPTQSAGD